MSPWRQFLPAILETLTIFPAPKAKAGVLSVRTRRRAHPNVKTGEGKEKEGMVRWDGVRRRSGVTNKWNWRNRRNGGGAF